MYVYHPQFVLPARRVCSPLGTPLPHRDVRMVSLMVRSESGQERRIVKFPLPGIAGSRRRLRRCTQFRNPGIVALRAGYVRYGTGCGSCLGCGPVLRARPRMRGEPEVECGASLNLPPPPAIGLKIGLKCENFQKRQTQHLTDLVAIFVLVIF